MRILVTIPHYFSPGSGAYGSGGADPGPRVNALTRTLVALHGCFSPHQGLYDIMGKRLLEGNQSLVGHLDVVICTTGDAQVLDRLDLPARCTYAHHATDVDGRLLGYECLKVHRSKMGAYDYHCFLEDDLVIHDPWFFAKLDWFNAEFGDDRVLMPNRYETSPNGSFQKVYVDANCAPRWVTPYQDIRQEPRLSARFLNRTIHFTRWPNPHGPGFFLNRRQFERWVSQPYYLDYDQGFIGPLESAQTLGVIKTFPVYKSAAPNAAFLEFHHVDNRYLDKRIRIQ